MRQARAKINNETFDEFRNDFVNNYKTRDAEETL
jgi:queuine/archaeosine tRNA-ribosyltransferase